MKLEEIYSNLCSYDKRSLDYEWSVAIFDDDLPEPRKNCYCDNCLYGRDRLALEILKLMGEQTK